MNRGTDQTGLYQAEAGLMHITGEPEGTPVKVGVAITGKLGYVLFRARC